MTHPPSSDKGAEKVSCKHTFYKMLDMNTKVCILCGIKEAVIHAPTKDEGGEKEELWDSDLWFSLSYASWLVLPRIALQSMPEEWQNRFFKMVVELNEKVVYPDGYEDLSFTVVARKGRRFTKHVLPSYRHNNLPLKP